MSIIEVKGDLLQSDCDVIAHGCNCYKNWGAGIAKQIKDLEPYAYMVDYNFDARPEDRLGTLTYLKAYSYFIFNLYTQLKYGREKGMVYVDYDAVLSSLLLMKLKLKYNSLIDYKEIKIGMPKIGCGLAQGDWKIIKSLIELVFREKDVWVYSL